MRARADERTGGRALTTRSGGRADERTGQKSRGRSGGQGRKGCGQWSGRADGRTGPTRRGYTDGWKKRRRGPARADGRTGGRANKWSSGQVDWAVGAYIAQTGGRANWAVGRTGQTGELGWTGVLAVRRSGGRAGGPGFKRPHSTRPTSLLGAPSACLVRARARRVLGNAVGSTTLPCQTPLLSARTHLPRLSASVLGAEKGILLVNPENGFAQGRW